MISSMSTATEENLVKIVLDTNILVSAIGFGGKPHTILQMTLENKIKAITSPLLLAEFEDVVIKKFPLLEPDAERVKKLIRKKFRVVKPAETIKAVADDPDNRVLEAAVTGGCQYVITGDKELLDLETFAGIQIVTPQKFLSIVTS